MSDASKFEVHPAGVVVFILFLVLSAAYILVPRDELAPLLGRMDEPAPEPDMPETLSVLSLAQQQEHLGADYAFELQSTSVRVFVYEVSNANYSAYAYRLEDSLYTQLSPSVHPTGYEAPFVGSEPPELLMREMRLGVLFSFSVEDGQLVFSPVDPDEVRLVDISDEYEH